MLYESIQEGANAKGRAELSTFLVERGMPDIVSVRK